MNSEWSLSVLISWVVGADLFKMKLKRIGNYCTYPDYETEANLVDILQNLAEIKTTKV